uniref:PHD finger protein 3 n=1 Tax=Noccaea caerulescens TaxID=107243 RepID=A0A1J3CP87_NOCCA
MSSNMGAEHISTHLETLKANPDTFEETNFIEMGSNDPLVQHMPVSDMKEELVASTSSFLDFPKEETSVSGPVSFNFEPEPEPEPTSFQPSLSVDSQSLMPQLQPWSVAKCTSKRSLQLGRKRKTPPESTLSGSASERIDAPNKRVEPVHHRPWLEQFYSASIQPAHKPATSLSPKAEHPPMLAKKVREKSGKQAMNKKQTGPSQGAAKTLNEGNESLRSKMKESLAAALALVLEHEESPKEKKNAETEEASVPPVAESNEPASASGTSVPETEGITPRDENSEQKDDNGRILPEETSSDTKMNYVNQSDVQTTQFDEVFHCDDVPFSSSIFSSDELLQGNGLSWVLEPVSDLGENETGGEKACEDPNLLASKIELELFKLFGGVNKKYKEKGRSLLFNLKDKNNPELRESVMSGKISPERLCSMTAEELASKELSQWRQAKAEEMAEMVVLRDTDIDVRSLVRKTHKGEFQVEIDPVDSVAVDVSAGITSRGKPRGKNRSAKSSNPAKSTLKKDSNDKNTKSDQGTSSDMTLPSTEEIDPMQGLSMDDEMKDVGFLPPIVSLDEFMESLNSEPPFGSPGHGNAVKEEAPASEKSDSEVGPHSESPLKSPKQSPKEPCESVSPTTKLGNSNVASPKPDPGVVLDADVSKTEKAPLVDSIKEEQIWDGILQLSGSSLVSVTGIFKSGEKAKTSEWPALVEVKGRVRLSAFGKFVQELPLSRSRVLMVMNVVCKDGISQSQRDSLFEVAKSYVADQRVGYAEPTSGVELYLCPPRGETLDLLSKIISKDHLDEVKCSDNTGLIGVVVWRRAVASPGSRHKPGFKRQHSSSGAKSSVLAPENKKLTTVNVTNQPPPAVASVGNHGLGGLDGDEDDLPPGFGPVAAKDDDDLPEFNFNASSGPVASSSPRPPPQSRSMDQVRELILKYGNSAGNGSGSKRTWNNHDDDDDDDDIPEWQPQVSGHQSHPLPPPPPPPGFKPEMDPQFHSRTISDGWRANQNDPRQQQYSARRNRGF